MPAENTSNPSNKSNAPNMSEASVVNNHPDGRRIAGPSSISPDCDLDNFENWTVEDFPRGMVAPAGSSASYYTGAWRQVKPLWNPEKCTNCMLCWINCADSAILMDKQKVCGINYHHCKGCGVCPIECRFGALVMVPEHSDHLEPEQSAVREPEITQGD